MGSQTETLVFSLSDSVSASQNNATVIPARSSSTTVPRDVRTEISYCTEPEGGASQLPIYINNKDSRVSTKHNLQPATVYDVRGSGVEHTLDKTGIQFLDHKSMVKDFSDDVTIKNAYYSEIADLLYKVTGASKVHIFHHIVRQAHTHYLYLKDQAVQEGDAAKDEEGEAKPISAEFQGPVRGVHIDQSYGYAPEVVKKEFPDEAEQLLKGRFQIINVWRPIKTIFKDPFAVLDATTVLEDELVNVQVIYPSYQFESVNVRQPLEGRKDGGHKWYYMSKQTPEDVLAFKIFDSKTDGRARRVPHSSFTDEEFEKMDARQSIEVRALVFHEDDIE